MRKIPAYGDQGGDITKSIARAGQRFLESLKAEAARSPVQARRRGRVVRVSKARATLARERGADLGEGFARLNGDRRTLSFVTAIEDGARAAARRDARDAALMNDAAHLRDSGFHGCDEDDPGAANWDEVLRGARL